MSEVYLELAEILFKADHVMINFYKDPKLRLWIKKHHLIITRKNTFLLRNFELIKPSYEKYLGTC